MVGSTVVSAFVDIVAEYLRFCCLLGYNLDEHHRLFLCFVAYLDLIEVIIVMV